MQTDEKLLSKTEDMLLSRFLSLVGIQPSRIGYSLIKDAVGLYLYGVKKMSTIQSQLSDTYKISRSAVERDIRSAIESAAMRDNLYNINSILGIDVLTKGEQISAKHFISLLAEYVNDPIVRKNLLKV